MKTLEGRDVNKHLAMYPTSGKLPFDWKGGVLDVLAEKSIRPEARLSVAIQLLKGQDTVLRQFAAWCADGVREFAGANFNGSYLALERLVQGRMTDAELFSAQKQTFAWVAEATHKVTDFVEAPNYAAMRYAREALAAAMLRDPVVAARQAASFMRRAAYYHADVSGKVTARGINLLRRMEGTQILMLTKLIREAKLN